MFTTSKSSFIAYIIMVVLGIFGSVVGIIATFWGTSTVKAVQPMSAKVVYVIDNTKVYCESPSGDKIYITAYGTTSGVSVSTWVVPGGCK